MKASLENGSLDSLGRKRKLSVLLIVAILVAAIDSTRSQDKEDNSDSAATLLAKAAAADDSSNYRLAVDLATRAIQSDAKLARAYYLRGRGNFCLDQIGDSLADFNKFIELEPGSETRLWERGITCYYAGQFAAGARQFELYQTYHSEDVENAVWQILCNSRIDGFPAASKKILPVRDDARVPMKQVYDLFRGAASPDDVTRAARTATDERKKRSQLFYADLYLGIYFDARDEKEKAKEHIKRAVDAREGHYMWEVAQIHLTHLNGRRD